jgi:hypothetical protein
MQPNAFRNPPPALTRLTAVPMIIDMLGALVITKLPAPAATPLMLA